MDIIIDGFNEIYRHLNEYCSDSVENLAEFMSHIMSETHLNFPWNRVSSFSFKKDFANSVNL